MITATRPLCRYTSTGYLTTPPETPTHACVLRRSSILGPRYSPHTPVISGELSPTCRGLVETLLLGSARIFAIASRADWEKSLAPPTALTNSVPPESMYFRIWLICLSESVTLSLPVIHARSTPSSLEASIATPCCSSMVRRFSARSFSDRYASACGWVFQLPLCLTQATFTLPTGLRFSLVNTGLRRVESGLSPVA